MHLFLQTANLTSLIDRYLRHLSTDRNLSPQSIRAYNYDLRLFADWCAHHSPADVTQDSIRLYFETIIHTGRLQDSTLKRKYISIKSFYRYLQQQGVVSDQRPVTLGKNFKKARRIPKTLSREEVRRLIASFQRDMQTLQSPFRRRICMRNRAIIEVLFSTGIRIGELVGIDLHDWDREKRTLLIFGKGRKERVLYLSSDAALEAVRAWLDERACFQPQTDALFVNKYGARLTIYSIEDIFYKYRDAANISHQATPHYLRHTFATQLLDNGADLRSVQEILGHSSVSTTEIYTEVSVQRKKDVLTRFNPRHDF